MFWRKTFMSLFLRSDKQKRPVRLSVRTAPFHGAKTGSIPVPATSETLTCKGFFIPTSADISADSIYDTNCIFPSTDFNMYIQPLEGSKREIDWPELNQPKKDILWIFAEKAKSYIPLCMIHTYQIGWIPLS
jgi:hypothetical protein